MVGLLRVRLHLAACSSLKEKRGRLKPLMNRLRREFNVSVAELDLQDSWQETIIGCAMLGGGRGHLEAALQAIARWLEGNWPDGMVVEQKIEIF